ncbi:MAG: RtcB family protein [Proteobacteria bacterium]|nr:RtcB family protein [Pseudomonadota bacterium]NBY21163.1 RtcB family protein [bacterium]
MRSNALQLGSRTLTEIKPGIWRVEPQGKMRVGVNIIASKNLILQIKDDKSIEQAANVATLPGVLDPVLTMPDIHQGYGFPIGGVAAFHEKTGVVSPGGVGYDINCGVRVLTTNISVQQLKNNKMTKRLVSELFDVVPCGVGSKRKDLELSMGQLDSILADGASWAVKNGFGDLSDLDFIEEKGRLIFADPEKVSQRARERGHNQLGTLGSGNHFLEIQAVDTIFDKAKALAFGLEPDHIVIMIHTGSRGLGYQVCSEYIELALNTASKYGIELVDRELAALPLESVEGKSYLGAMAAAANFAFNNRQIISFWVKETFKRHFPNIEFKILYDICHNIAKWEEFHFPSHRNSQRVCIHRKGATRAYPPRHPSLPQPYLATGQPVIVPGDMGRFSFILAGSANSMELSLGSACHGAGRELSRAQAKKQARGRSISRELEEHGVFLKASGRDTVEEEMPEAYKDINEVVEAIRHAKIASFVARLKPVGVIKG